jgi:iron complex transport system substrate-binding protein
MTPRASGWGSPTTWKSRAPSSPRHRLADRPRTHTRWCGFVALLLPLACTSPPTRGVTDQVGALVPAGPVRRIVALAPDVTELAFAVGAGSLVVAVPPAADFPPEVAALPRVAPNDAEAIVAFRPDMVLATTAGNDPRVVQRLRQLGERVCTMDVTSFTRLAEASRLTGDVLGFPGQGARLAQEVDESVARSAETARSLTVRKAVYVVWWEPLIVAAPGTFPDDLLRRAGLVNLAPRSAGRYPRVDPEILLDPRLEVVVAPDERDLRDSFARVADSPAGTRLASQAITVFWLPADLADRPGPRLPAALAALVAARATAERQDRAARAPEPGTRQHTENHAAAPQGRAT